MSTTAHTGSRASAAKGLESAIDDITAFGAAAARDARTAARDAKAGIDDVVADVSEKGREAMQGAREVRDTVSDAILDSIRTRPYTTLAIAGLIGFLYGAMRRR